MRWRAREPESRTFHSRRAVDIVRQLHEMAAMYQLRVLERLRLREVDVLTLARAVAVVDQTTLKSGQVCPYCASAGAEQTTVKKLP